MTDLMPGMPPRLPTVSFTPAAKGYEVARGGARRRRRSRLVLGGGAAGSALAAVVAVSLLSGPSATQVLDQADRRPMDERSSAPSTATPVPGVSALPSTGARAPGPAPSPVVSLLATLRPSAKPQPSATATRPAPATGRDLEGPEPTFTAYEVGQKCDGSGYTAANGWCSAHSGARTARRGSVVELATSMCRLPGQPDAEVRASDGQYADFAITDDRSALVWRWSFGKRFSEDPRMFTVPAGQCIRFAVTWNVRRNDGTSVAAGDYVLTSTPRVTVPGVFVREQKPITFVVT